MKLGNRNFVVKYKQDGEIKYSQTIECNERFEAEFLFIRHYGFLASMGIISIISEEEYIKELVNEITNKLIYFTFKDINK